MMWKGILLNFFVLSKASSNSSHIIVNQPLTYTILLTKPFFLTCMRKQQPREIIVHSHGLSEPAPTSAPSQKSHSGISWVGWNCPPRGQLLGQLKQFPLETVFFFIISFLRFFFKSYFFSNNPWSQVFFLYPLPMPPTYLPPFLLPTHLPPSSYQPTLPTLLLQSLHH